MVTGFKYHRVEGDNMLEGFEIQGLDQLNTLAAYFLGSAIIVLVLGLAVGITMWRAGRSRGGGNLGDHGLKTAGIAVVGAIVLGGIGGGVQWGSGLGDSELLPTAAQPQDITIQREAAKVTCEAVTKDFSQEYADLVDSGEPDHDMLDRHREWVLDLIGEEYADEAALQPQAMLMAVTWHPDGEAGDCSDSNKTVAQCSEVTFDAAVGAHDETLYIDGPDCDKA